MGEKKINEQSDLTGEDIRSVWSYKGVEYRIELFVEMKDPQDGNWYQGVLYNRLDNSNEKPYVRYESDFLRKFRRVQPGGE